MHQHCLLLCLMQVNGWKHFTVHEQEEDEGGRRGKKAKRSRFVDDMAAEDGGDEDDDDDEVRRAGAMLQRMFLLCYALPVVCAAPLRCYMVDCMRCMYLLHVRLHTAIAL